MAEYSKLVSTLRACFQRMRVSQISSGQNSHADSLATLASSMDECFPCIISIEVLNNPCIECQQCVAIVSTHGPRWINPIISFISNGVLPSEAKEVEKIRRNSVRFWLSKDKRLYRWSFRGSYLLCLHLEAVEGLLAKLHEWVCNSHTGGGSLAHRAMTQGFWWLNMQRDATEYVKKYDQCQKHALNIHQPRGTLNSISSPWPFA